MISFAPWRAARAPRRRPRIDDPAPARGLIAILPGSHRGGRRRCPGLEPVLVTEIGEDGVDRVDLGRGRGAAKSASARARPVGVEGRCRRSASLVPRRSAERSSAPQVSAASRWSRRHSCRALMPLPVLGRAIGMVRVAPSAVALRSLTHRDPGERDGDDRWPPFRFRRHDRIRSRRACWRRVGTAHAGGLERG